MIRLSAMAVIISIIAAAAGQVWAASILTTTITADRMSVQQLKHTALFEGSVVLQRKNFEMKCDRLLVHYDPNHNGEIRRADAYGHVGIVHGHTHGTANEATYDQHLGNITLIGNAELSEPGRTVHGDKIVHDLKKQATQIENNGSGRVHVHINSKGAAATQAPKKETP